MGLVLLFYHKHKQTTQTTACMKKTRERISLSFAKVRRKRDVMPTVLCGKNTSYSGCSLRVKQCEGFQRMTDLPLKGLGLHLWILTPLQDFRAATRKLRTL